MIKPYALSYIKNLKKSSFWLFTILFLGFFGILSRHYIADQMIIMGGTDGVQQHYPAMVFISRYFRLLFDNLRHGKLEIPLVNYEIGMGDDIITTLNYYGFGDPFYILSIFFPESGIHWFYTCIFYLRVYLGGAVFLLLSQELVPEKGVLPYVAGAFLYCFSGFCFEADVHIIFVHAMIYIPLMIYAVERILKNKRWGKRLLIFSVCCSGLSGFFFTYIGVLTTAIYTIIRAVILQKGEWNPIKKFIIKTGFSGALGLGMAAAVLVPAVMGYLTGTRAGGKVKLPLLYDADTYKNMFYTLFMGKELYRSTFAFPIVGVLVLVLAVSIRGHKWEKAVIIGCAIGYLVPVFSWIGTGFSSTIYDRWEIVLIIGASLVFVSTWDKILTLTKKDLAFFCIFFGLIIFLGFADDMFSDRCYRNMLLAFSGCMLFFIGQELFLKRKYLFIRKWIWFGLTIGCITLSWCTIKMDYPLEAVSRDKAAEALIKDEAFYRVENEETFMGVTQINLALSQNYCSTAAYFSIENPIYITTMNNDWALPLSNGFAVSGLDRRAMLESLCGVKYMLLMKGHEYLAPYGFIYSSKTVDERWQLYENQCVMPLAYTYNEVIDYEEYQKMDALEKQVIMCQQAAVKDYHGSIDKGEKPGFAYQMEACNVRGISEESYAPDIYSEKEGRVITVSVPVKANCENYLLIEDTAAKGLQKVRWKDSCISPYMSETSKNFINLGYSDTDGEIVTELLIDSASSFDVNQIRVAHVDMSDYMMWLEERASEPMQNIELNANQVKGSIEVSRDKILCTTIPYLKGWSAFIDGKQVPLYQVNSLFMGIEIPAGIHEICFSYCTPGIKTGMLIMALSVIGCLVWYWQENRVACIW